MQIKLFENEEFGKVRTITIDGGAWFVGADVAIAEARGVSDEEVKRSLVVDYGSLARDDDGKIIGFKLPSGVDVSFIYPYTKLYRTIEENGKQFNRCASTLPRCKGRVATRLRRRERAL